MSYRIFYLYFVLCSIIVSSEVITDHFGIIQQYVKLKIDDSHNNDMINVTIRESEACNIYIHKHNYPMDDKQEHTIHAFYIALNCKFADWTMNKMYDLIMSTPWFYGSKMQNNSRVNKTVFKSYFDRSVQNIIIIDKYIGRFINILRNFISKNSHASYYTDTATLKSLMSLKYVINFTLLNIDKKYKLDDDIIPLILLEVNALQSFLSMNCKQISGYRNLHFYGYWITAIDEILIDVDTIDNFLFNIKDIELESNLLNCSVTQMLLENIVTISSDDHISSDIVNAKLQLTDTDKVSIRDILEQTKTSYDIGTLFQYQDSVLSTIMKLIYTKIIYFLSTDKNVPSVIVEKIKNIKRLISTNTTNLPAYAIDGFTLLTNIDQQASGGYNYERDHSITKDVQLIKKLQNYNDSLSNIILFEEWDTSLANDKPIVLCNNNVKSNQMALKDCILVSYTEQDKIHNKSDNTIIYLEKIMTKIIDNFDDFKCFNKSYKYLDNRNDNNYHNMSFIDNNTQHFIPNISISDNNQLDGVCDLILNTYSICWQAINIITNGRNYDKSSNQKIKNELYFNSVWKLIDSINQDHFILIIESNTNNLDLFKIAFNIVIILVNIQNQSGKLIDDYHLKRILHVLMTEMNNYGLQYCRKFDFLLFNKININYFNKDSLTINYDIKNSTKTDKYNYLNVKFFYDRFIKNSDVLKLYGVNIKFFWNEKKQTVKEIYKNAMYTTLNIHSLYILFDIYFKFYLAVIYYEINDVFFKKKSDSIKKKLSAINRTLSEFKYEYFPSKLKPFLSDIKKLLELPEAISEAENIKLSESKNCIDEQFKKFNIVFEKPVTIFQIIKQGVENIRINLFSDSAITKINYELSNNVNVIHKKLLIFLESKHIDDTISF